MRRNFALLFSWLSLYGLALLLGSQSFDAAVLTPRWTASAQAFQAWYSSPLLPNVPGWFRLLLPSLWITTLVAALLAIPERGPRRQWAFLAAAGMTGHAALVLLWFVPTNQSLGIIPGSEGATITDPAVIASLLDRWRTMNVVRLSLDAGVFFAAARAVVSPTPDR